MGVTPPQLCGDVQVPQLATVREVPQLSGAVTEPQFAPTLEQKVASFSGTHAQTLVAPHVSGATHVPQVAVRPTPQLSLALTEPQFFPSRAQNATLVSAAQPQTFGTPDPPQLWFPVQAPQSAVRLVPQLSAAVTESQFLPSRAQNAVFDSAAQAQVFAVPPPPQVSGDVQVPQSAVREMPQLSALVTLPQVAPRRAQKAVFVSPVQPHTFAVPPPPHD